MTTALGYRDLLKQHFAERMESNPRYSLRAFSRDLAISPSRLSEILNGKQGLSEKWALKIADRLELSEREKEEFRQRVLASDGRAKSTRASAAAHLEVSTAPLTLEADTFRVISDWYHFGLIELTKVKGFRSDPAWIGRRLGVTEYEAKLAVERLVRLGLLAETKGRLRCTNGSLTTTNGVPSEAIRKFNRQILEKARDSISAQSVDERDLSTLTLAVRKQDLPAVKERIRKFRRELNAELEAVAAEGEAEEVYSLSVSFFRLSCKENP